MDQLSDHSILITGFTRAGRWADRRELSRVLLSYLIQGLCQFIIELGRVRR
uniref:Uncharacterized protein n=1 Tax=Anguilla anguilla TaxID=7936 RepID=A0A0E9UCZ2_ANGAN